VVGLDEVGEQFGCGEMFLPDLVQAAEAMKVAVAILEPEMARSGSSRRILSTHQPDPLAPELAKELQRIIASVESS
jgi:cobalamin-dependent methionine synthase I